MIGVGTNAVNLGEFSSRFVSLLGKDSESWGLSYSGNLVHNGIKRNVCKRFGQGMTIGIHLDMWLGRLSLFRNGHHIGKFVQWIPFIEGKFYHRWMMPIKSRQLVFSYPLYVLFYVMATKRPSCHTLSWKLSAMEVFHSNS